MSIHMKLGGAVAGLLMFGGVAYADSISPETYSDTLAVGESVTITKTVTVSAGKPTSSIVDVFFLADTTGSMSGQIAAVRNASSAIATALEDYGSIQFGVGEYKDVPRSGWGSSGDFPWRLNTAVTSDDAAVTAGLAQWSASGGADGPESNMIGLERAANDAAVGWRDGSAKFIVWFGDVEGHTPQNTAGYPGPSVADTILALNAKGITVIAVGSGLDGGPEDQATQITVATGGTFYSSFAGSSAAIADQIDNAIAAAFSTYTTVGLDITGVPAGVTVTTSPAHVGAYTRETEREFTFDVTFTGVTPGSYDFAIHGTVDGARVATELDSITVTGGGTSPVPLPAGLPLMLGALAMGGLVARRRRS